ncbi:hypothetical protein DVH24_005114 [Malus domestica]|uniref:Uncharacterized protein n=1 Tax=Malus domestica TaxID=3750 RepID=A0A498IDF4_MALDO|nr:hypothetical protein DVH24_005114 [Malus domestica]
MDLFLLVGRASLSEIAMVTLLALLRLFSRRFSLRCRLKL